MKFKSIIIDRSTVFITTFASAVFLLPLFILRWKFPISAKEAAIAAVGVGSISRTLLRGVFGVGFKAAQRSGLRTIEESAERSTLRVVERSAERSAIVTSERIAERALVRAGGRTIGRVLTRISTRSAAKWLFSLIGHRMGEGKLTFFAKPIVSIPMTFIVLMTSFWWVTRNLLFSSLIIIPAIFLFLLEYLLAKYKKVKFTISAPPDGIVLQYIFAATGSFMPMASEVKFEGEKKSIAHVGLFTILIMIITGVVLREIGINLHASFFGQIGDIFLIFPLILSFPLPPLEGYAIFRESKILSLLIWALSMFAFVYFGSEVITSVI